MVQFSLRRAACSGPEPGSAHSCPSCTGALAQPAVLARIACRNKSMQNTASSLSLVLARDDPAPLPVMAAQPPGYCRPLPWFCIRHLLGGAVATVAAGHLYFRL